LNHTLIVQLIFLSMAFTLSACFVCDLHINDNTAKHCIFTAA